MNHKRITLFAVRDIGGDEPYKEREYGTRSEERRVGKECL